MSKSPLPFFRAKASSLGAPLATSIANYDAKSLSAPPKATNAGSKVVRRQVGAKPSKEVLSLQIPGWQQNLGRTR